MFRLPCINNLCNGILVLQLFQKGKYSLPDAKQRDTAS